MNGAYPFEIDENIDYEKSRKVRKREYDILKLDNDYDENNWSIYKDKCMDIPEFGYEKSVDKSNGRPGMQHPTKVYGEITR